MKINILLQVFIFCCTNFVGAQQYFLKSFGDSVNYSEWAGGMALSVDSNIFLNGFSISTLTGRGEVPSLIIDINGNEILKNSSLLSNRSFESGVAHDVIRSNSNQFYVGGFAYTNFASLSSEAYLIKFDENGDTVYTKSYNMGYRAYILDVKQLQDGNFITCGYMQPLQAVNGDAFVMKVDSSGNIIWQQFYGVSGFQETAYSLLELTNHKLLIAGDWNGDLTTPQDSTQAFLMCLDSMGNLQWQKFYARNFGTDVFHILATRDSGFILTGTSFFGMNNTNQWAYVAKTDSSGNEQWHNYFQMYPGSYAEFFTCTEGINRGYYLSGAANDSAFQTRGWFVRLDDSGNLLWQEHYTAGSYLAYLTDIRMLGANDFLMCGTINHPGGSAKQDYLVIRTDSLGCFQNCWTGMGEINFTVKEDGITVHPNPSDGVFIFENNTFSEIEKTEVFNSIGDKIIEQEGMIKEINLSDKQEGIYLYRITFHGGKIIQGKLLKL